MKESIPILPHHGKKKVCWKFLDSYKLYLADPMAFCSLHIQKSGARKETKLDKIVLDLTTP